MIENYERIITALREDGERRRNLFQKFVGRRWIGQLANPTEEGLVNVVLGKIERNPQIFRDFLEMLNDIPGMDETVEALRSSGMTIILTHSSVREL